MKDPIPKAALQDPRLRVIFDSFNHLTGKDLIGCFDPLAMWNADRAIVAHGLEADPVFFYGNRMALQCFEMDFDAFVRLPSRLSAEPLARPLRARLLDEVTRRGYVDNYCGVRIASSGNRFTISDGTVWNLVDAMGVCHGQAATFVIQPDQPAP